jgi:hypothetical protein
VPLTHTSGSLSSLGPENDTVFCYNDPVTQILSKYVMITGGSGNYLYKWYFATDIKPLAGFGNYDTTVSWTLIPSATTPTYSPPPVTQSIRYKRVTTDANCPSLTRNDFSYVLHLYKVDVIKATQKTCTPTIDAEIIDETADPLWQNTAKWYSIQWESSTTETGTYAPITGATDFLYTPEMQTNSMFYRRKYTNQYFRGACATQTTNAVAINPVTCLTFSTSISGPTSVTPNQASTYSVPVQSGMTYLWSVTGGIITGGQGTYTITILWDGGISAENYSVSVKETNDIALSNTTTQDVTMTMITTGINQSFGVSGISVFPNPSRDQFNIVMPHSNTAVTYTLYSTTGVNLQSGSFTSSTSGTSIQTSLPAGIYQLVLNYDGVFTSTRLAVY